MNSQHQIFIKKLFRVSSQGLQTLQLTDGLEFMCSIQFPDDHSKCFREFEVILAENERVEFFIETLYNISFQKYLNSTLGQVCLVLFKFSHG